MQKEPRELTFDLEANGLLRGNNKSSAVSKVWMVVARDLKTQEEFVFCDYATDKEARPLVEFKQLFDNAKCLIGHNIIQYDLPVLKKILGWVPKNKTVIRDTLLMSQMLNYKRFPGGRHNLAIWGEY